MKGGRACGGEDGVAIGTGGDGGAGSGFFGPYNGREGCDWAGKDREGDYYDGEPFVL